MTASFRPDVPADLLADALIDLADGPLLDQAEAWWTQDRVRGTHAAALGRAVIAYARQIEAVLPRCTCGTGFLCRLHSDTRGGVVTAVDSVSVATNAIGHEIATRLLGREAPNGVVHVSDEETRVFRATAERVLHDLAEAAS